MAKFGHVVSVGLKDDKIILFRKTNELLCANSMKWKIRAIQNEFNYMSR